MFQLIEPSAGQVRNTVPVHSISAHCGIPYFLQNDTDIKYHVLFYYSTYFNKYIKIPVFKI
jgi:hypothetical protein